MGKEGWVIFFCNPFLKSKLYSTHKLRVCCNWQQTLFLFIQDLTACPKASKTATQQIMIYRAVTHPSLSFRASVARREIYTLWKNGSEKIPPCASLSRDDNIGGSLKQSDKRESAIHPTKKPRQKLLPWFLFYSPFSCSFWNWRVYRS